MKSQIGEDLELQSVVRILKSKENWQAFQKFTEVVLTKKENKEREEEEIQRDTKN